MPETKKGLIIVFSGPGKGKTTAALGTAFRAVGQGLRVLMIQFIKGSWHYGELDACRMLGEDRMTILPMGRGFVKVGVEKPDPEIFAIAIGHAGVAASEAIFVGDTYATDVGGAQLAGRPAAQPRPPSSPRCARAGGQSRRHAREPSSPPDQPP